MYTGVGLGSDMVGGEAAVGRRARGVRERHVERDRLRDQLPVRRDGGAQGRGLLQGADGERGRRAQGHRRAPALRVGRLGPHAHIRGALLRGEHLQVRALTSFD